MKALAVLLLVLCMAFVANAEYLPNGTWAWRNPAADPFDGTLEDAVNLVNWWPENVKEDVKKSNFPVEINSEVKKNELVGGMTFGSGKNRKIRRNVQCIWDGFLLDRKTGKKIMPVPDQAPAREMIFIYDKGDLIHFYRVRQCDWCTNFLFDDWTEPVKPKLQTKVIKPKPKPKPRPERKEVKQIIKPEPKHFSLNLYTRFNHFDNNQFSSLDRYMYDEGEAGVSLNWRPTKWKHLRCGLDVGLDGRIHTVNGEEQVLDGLLYKLSPSISLNPVWRTYLMARYMAVFSNNGLDGQTILGLFQYYLPVGKGILQPMIQVGGSATQVEPRYLGYHGTNPAPLALYYEAKSRLQLLSFWQMRMGWEATWFWYYGTRLGQDLERTTELRYISYARPKFGGPFAVIDLPWGLQLDATMWRQEILAETFVTTEEESYWVAGQKEEWRWNIELTKRFRIGIF